MSRKALVDVLRRQIEREGEENALLVEIMKHVKAESRKSLKKNE